MTDNFTNFNFRASLARMDRILQKSDNNYSEKNNIPSLESLNHTDGHYVTCAALCVDIRESSLLPQKHTKPVLAKIYRAYTSEVIALLRSHKLCRHIRIDGDAVLGIFDVRQQRLIVGVFELSWKLSSLIKALNDKFEKRGYERIRVGIGLSYGEVLMIKAGLSGSGYNDIVWMGEAINKASKLSGAGNKEPHNGDREIMVAKQFFEKLPTNYKQFLHWSDYRNCYTGAICNYNMDSFYQKISRSRPKPVVQSMLPSYQTNNTLLPYQSSPLGLSKDTISELIKIFQS